MKDMIKIGRLTKKFGSLTAVNQISLTVKRGEVLGFLGPNGAGKSTTMKMLTGYLPITSGKASICGFDVITKPIDAKKCIGYLPEGSPLYGDMSCLSFLDFVAEIRGFSGNQKKESVNLAIERLELGSVVNKPIETLSKGFKRRVGLAQSILHDPEVLILDEPTDGLDPNQKHQVRNLIKLMASNKAIIISTHLLEEVSAVCSRAIIISKGQIVFDGTPEEFAARSSLHNAVTIRLSEEDVEGVCTVINGIAGVERIGTLKEQGSIRVLPKSGEVIVGPVSSLMRENGFKADEIFVERGHLDEVFRDLTITS